MEEGQLQSSTGNILRVTEIFCLDCGGGYTSCMSLSKLPELCNLGLHQKKDDFYYMQIYLNKKKIKLNKRFKERSTPTAGNQGMRCGVEKSMLTSECLYL